MFAGNVYEWRKDVHIELGQPMPKFSRIVYLNGVMFQSETYRVGEEAYDGHGESLASFRPTFIQISEFESKALRAIDHREAI